MQEKKKRSKSTLCDLKATIFKKKKKSLQKTELKHVCKFTRNNPRSCHVDQTEF